jgi:glutathione synthase/RimK-type ligase-like ATP-grasp enzyme
MKLTARRIDANMRNVAAQHRRRAVIDKVEINMAQKVGLLVGRERAFPEALIDEVSERDQGVAAEHVKLGGSRISDPIPYAVILDRISHDVPYYRSFLKNAALQGVRVINNPFMWSADDKFFGASAATKLGIACPKTVALPNKDYGPGIVHPDSLRNLIAPLDWQAVIDHVGMPCVLKNAHSGTLKQVFICHSLDELIYCFDQSGQRTMVVQEYIEWEHYVRCFCLGQKETLVIKYDPNLRRYSVDHEHLTRELGGWIVDDSLKLVQAFGYDMNAIDWAIRDGVPYAIDFLNLAPEIDPDALTPFYFDQLVTQSAAMIIRMAKNRRSPANKLKWGSLFE